MTDLTIVYLKMRALAEAPQLMLSYRGESYRYRMAWDYFGAPWPEVKPDLPFRQLPMLVTEAGERIVQSGSIMRYLAQRLGMTSADPLRAAAIDEIFEGSQELFFPLNPTVNFFTGDKFRESREALLKTLGARLEDFERLLSRYDGPFSSTRIQSTAILGFSTMSIWRIFWTKMSLPPFRGCRTS